LNYKIKRMKFIKPYGEPVYEYVEWVNDVLIGLSVVSALAFIKGFILDILKNESGFARGTYKFIVLRLALREIKTFVKHPDLVEIRKVDDGGEEKILIRPTNVEHFLVINFTKKIIYFTGTKESDVFDLSDKDILKLKRFLKV
jgi:hypothetical protein